MKVPNCDSAIIPLRKITKYLLSDTHSIGRTKAKFFLEIGFNSTNLKVVLKQHITENDVTEEIKTKFGDKYVIKSDMVAPNGRKYKLCTIWIIETNKRNPYFVTAYPI